MKDDDLVCFVGDFNIAPSAIDIHAPHKYEGGIMASKMEREAINNAVSYTQLTLPTKMIV